MGHGYLGHDYLGHDCIGHNHMGHGYIGHCDVRHNYTCTQDSDYAKRTQSMHATSELRFAGEISVENDKGVVANALLVVFKP